MKPLFLNRFPIKRIFCLLLAAAMLLSLTACGKGKADMDFTAVLPGNVTTLDPQIASGQAAGTVIGSIFEGLCRIGEHSEALPGVAERWDHSKDYTRFTFHLRKAYWSNGEQVTADDFIFGILRALDHNNGASALDDLFLIKNARAYYNGELSADALGLIAQGDRTLVVHLETGYADFPVLTAGNHYMPCSRAYFEESAGHYGLSAGYILTNGPFTFPHMYAWDTDYNERRISLVRSDTYKGEQKVIAGSLTYLIDYDDSIDEDPVAALQQGSVDIIELSEKNAKAAEENGCGVLAVPDGVLGLLLNPDSDALYYRETRRLFVESIDRADLLQRGANELDGEASGVMPDCVLWNGKPYYDQSPACYTQQDDQVTQIIPSLLDLLQRDNVPTITVLCADDDRSIQIANGLLINWNHKLSSAFNILPLPEDQLNRRVANGDYDAALYTLRAGGLSPLNVAEAFSQSASPQLMDIESYNDALRGLDFTLAGFQEIEACLRDQYVFYPLFTDRSYYAIAPGVGNITVAPDRHIDFTQAKKRERK